MYEQLGLPLDALHLKRCRACEHVLPYAEFSRDKQARDGLQSACKPCSRARSRAYHAANADAVSTRHKRNRAADPSKARELSRRWRSENAEYDRERHLKWRAGNRDRVNAANARYRDKMEPAERSAMWQESRHRRRAREAGNSVFPITKAQMRHIAQDPCVYCSRPGGEVDHVRPVSRGGAHHIANLVSACRSCNSSKKDKLVTEWDEVFRVARAVVVSPKVASEYAQLRQAVYERLGRPLGVHLLRPADRCENARGTLEPSA